LLKPNNGEVILCDHNIYHDNDDARLKLRRYDVGIIFQSHYLFKGFFANENIELASFISDKTIDKGILERLGIADFMHYRVGDLSGGQQQRVSIARAIGHDPEILFADEPTANLDSETSLNVLQAFIKLHEEGQTIIMVTHEKDYAEMTDRIITLADGQIVSDVVLTDSHSKAPKESPVY
jgi:putative ABC transport system ATP-binding protein